MKIISKFIGKYDFLSNFYPVNVQFEDLNFPTVEHAYQAAKSTKFSYRREISLIHASKAGIAKRKGQTVILRRDWEKIKFDIMATLLRSKFENTILTSLLISTDNAILIEGNYWHDNIWGDCKCKNCSGIEGKNHLGNLLMELRTHLNEKNTNHRRYTR